MLIMTDMDTGKKRVEPTDEYSEEVLLSNWTPPQLELGLGLQGSIPAKPERPKEAQEATKDAEAFMRAIYLSQE